MTEKLKEQIVRSSLGQQVAQMIRRDIIRGSLKPGTVLVQEYLCDLYGVSRVPVRDALFTLLAEGFLYRNRRNQMVTIEWTTEDLIDTFRIEALLCGFAARLTTIKASDETLDEVSSILERGEEALKVSDRAANAQASWDFHRRINKAAESRRLLISLRSVSVSFAQDFMSEIPDWWSRSQEQHHDILTAIHGRDSERAEELMRWHFEDAGRYLADYLQEHKA